jgi:hypothetical protein
MEYYFALHRDNERVYCKEPLENYMSFLSYSRGYLHENFILPMYARASLEYFRWMQVLQHKMISKSNSEIIPIKDEWDLQVVSASSIHPLDTRITTELNEIIVDPQSIGQHTFLPLPFPWWKEKPESTREQVIAEASETGNLEHLDWDEYCNAEGGRAQPDVGEQTQTEDSEERSEKSNSESGAGTNDTKKPWLTNDVFKTYKYSTQVLCLHLPGMMWDIVERKDGLETTTFYNIRKQLEDLLQGGASSSSSGITNSGRGGSGSPGDTCLLFSLDRIRAYVKGFMLAHQQKNNVATGNTGLLKQVGKSDGH